MQSHPPSFFFLLFILIVPYSSIRLTQSRPCVGQWLTQSRPCVGRSMFRSWSMTNAAWWPSQGVPTSNRLFLAPCTRSITTLHYFCPPPLPQHPFIVLQSYIIHSDIKGPPSSVAAYRGTPVLILVHIERRYWIVTCLRYFTRAELINLLH